MFVEVTLFSTIESEGPLDFKALAPYELVMTHSMEAANLTDSLLVLVDRQRMNYLDSRLFGLQILVEPISY